MALPIVNWGSIFANARAPITGITEGLNQSLGTLLNERHKAIADALNKFNLQKGQEMLPLEKQLKEALIQKYSSEADYNKQLYPLNIESKKAATKKLKAETERLTQQQEFLNNIFKGTQATPTLPTSNVVGGLQGLQVNQSQVQPGMPGMGQQQPQSQLNIPGQTGSLTYPQIAAAMKMAGFGQPQTQTVDGNIIATSPFGNVPIYQGLSPQQKAFQQGLGTYNAKFYGENVESVRGLQNQNVALDELTNLIEKNPDFSKVTGPIKSVLTSWLGTPAQKELLGRLRSASGEISLQVAPAIKGAFTGRDQTLINSIKANPNDFPDVFVGKLKSQKLVNTVLMKRAELTAQYMEEGMSGFQASKRAAKEVPLDKYRDQIDNMITHKKIYNGQEYHWKNGKWYPYYRLEIQTS